MNKLTVIGKNKTCEFSSLEKVDDWIMIREDGEVTCTLQNCETKLQFQVEPGVSFTLTILGANSKLHLKYRLLEGSCLKVNHLSKEDDVTMEVELGTNACFDGFYRTLAFGKHCFKETIHHLGNNSKSIVVNHGVNFKGESLCFEVNGIVPKGVVDCVCNQENAIIELGKGTSRILPNLLIEEHRVEASHSAYIGSFQEEELFYLESRGISKEMAYRLLLEGFFLGEQGKEEWKEQYFKNL